MADNSDRYDSTLNYLYGLQKHGIKLGLTNIRELMNMLGRPQDSFRSIHIAGTNGKGSTATAVSSILMKSGLRVGLFTSPHLVSFTERIRINDRCIAESDVIEIAHRLRTEVSATDLNPTFFEIVTAMAFYYFSCNNVDWAVVETGMGGRLDATNVLHPEVTVITNIGIDHCEFLGNSISDITYEKGGIIKSGVPLVTASRNEDVIKQLSGIAYQRNSEIHIYDRDFRGNIIEIDDRHISVDYEGYRNYRKLTVPLSGEYQLYNMCTAIRVCEILREKGLPISDLPIKSGLEDINLQGRLEWVSQNPPILIDCAHNPDAARSLAVSVTRLFSDKKIILIAGIMSDKDIMGILLQIAPLAVTVILTAAKCERAALPEKLKKVMSDIYGSGANPQPSSVTETGTVREALDLARSLCGKDHIILVTGSFYITGEVKEILGAESILPRLREYT
ncbi:MAG TPA: bifunctional folylpolyglutamate synthase/dihydrofolate synthase [Nitrospiraceae bacterium]|nr:bifunctional folylpolyglutamate synthase/dihydrofolate synthase [Nitrospiraceae bacterium]